jgi:alpha-tubulin suppressor-like RCC1 family protein
VKRSICSLSLIVAGVVALVPASASAKKAERVPSPVVRWGSYGSRGSGKKVVPTEEKFAATPASIVKVDAGNAESFALDSSGVLWAFGSNKYGQLGIGDSGSTDKDLTATPVDFPSGIDVTAVGEGREAGFAVDSTGQGWAWGRAPGSTKKKGEGDVSSLCLGLVKEDVTTPAKIPGLTGVRAVQGGGTHVLWLTDGGSVEACGAGEHGQLGDASLASSLTPVAVKGLSDVVEISAGKASSCARTASGEVFTWGDDNHGQVGNGHVEEVVSSPYHVVLPGPASDISCGGNTASDGSTLALVNGHVYGWGADEVDQLGDGQSSEKPSPTLAVETSSLHVTQVVASGETGLALSAEGDVYGWGSASGYALGLPESAGVVPAPHLITTGVAEISATAFDALARLR